MEVNFLGDKMYSVEELDSIEIEELEPNDCGVLMGAVYIIAYRKKNDHLYIEIGRNGGKYYTGYDYWDNKEQGGGSSGVCLPEKGYDPPSYQTVKAAFIGQLKAFAGMRYYKTFKVDELLKKIAPEPEPTPNRFDGCLSCPMWIVRARAKKGVVYLVRDCTTDICDVMRNNPTQEDVDFFCTFHKEPTDGEVKPDGYADWLERVNKKFNMAQAPKLW